MISLFLNIFKVELGVSEQSITLTAHTINMVGSRVLNLFNMRGPSCSYTLSVLGL